MSQIRKGFIASNAIDGTKLKLLNNEAVRAANADGTDAELMKLDSSNVLQFLKLPQVSADPSAANDVARKSYVDSTVDTAKGELQDAVDAEQAARELADAGLQSAIDTEVSDRQAAVSAEASARQAADSDLQDAIDVEKGRIDAILSAATADADSFAEIVSLINSVDTTNDAAFASYVLSNDAALAQEVSDRQSGDSDLQDAIDAEASARASAVSSEASARQAADTTLQSNIDSETSARQSAVSSEASARQAADAALQSAIDALTVDDMTDVSTSSKTDGDLFQWDSSEGKWKNVAPLTEASTTVVVVPGNETLISSFTNTSDYNDGSGSALGITYAPASNVQVSKVGLKIGRTSNMNTSVSAKIYQVSYGTMEANGTSFNPADFTLVATSTNTLSPSDMALYPAAPDMEYFTFNNVALTGGSYYVIWAEVSGISLGSGGSYLAPAYGTGSMGQFTTAHYKQIAAGGQYGGLSDLALGYEIYTGSAGSSSSEAAVGVIKTNASGMLDESFLEYDVNFGGHKLQGVSAPTSGTDAANKTYVDGEVASEASARSAADTTLQNNIDAEATARQAAVSAEATARQAADQDLQDQIDALDSGSTAGLTQEIADRQAGDDALDARLDVIEGSDSTEGSVAKAEKDAKDYADSIMATEQSARQAADTTLQANIDTEKARIDAILLASDADKDSFAEIVNLINSVDTTNDNAFAAYVLSNDAALAQEVSDRQSAVSSEQSAREAADDALDARLDVLEGSDTTEGSVAKAEKDAKDHADSIVASEQSAREAADSAMDARLDVLEGSDSTEGSVAKAEKDAKDYADSLNSTESAARSAADTTLQSNIDSEAAARSAADSAEQAAREAADSDLQDAIDAEQAAREAAVSAEQSAREAADSALDTRVDALEGIQHRKEKFTLTSTDISNGYVDLSMEAIANSEMVFVGALYFHSTDHYSVSTVGGVTRLTWTGPVAVGGASELVAGDIVYVRYTK